jgi:hypothetical protein
MILDGISLLYTSNNAIVGFYYTLNTGTSACESTQCAGVFVELVVVVIDDSF